MPETRIPKQVIKWKHLGRRKHRRLRRSWQEGIDKIMQRRNLGDGMWRGRQEWRADIGKYIMNRLQLLLFLICVRTQRYKL